MRLTPADSLPTANRSFTFKYYGDVPAPQGTTPRDVMEFPLQVYLLHAYAMYQWRRQPSGSGYASSFGLQVYTRSNVPTTMTTRMLACGPRLGDSTGSFLVVAYLRQKFTFRFIRQISTYTYRKI